MYLNNLVLIILNCISLYKKRFKIIHYPFLVIAIIYYTYTITIVIF